jgi:hypothetical protein
VTKDRPTKKSDPTVKEAELEFSQGLMDMRFLEGSARVILTMSDGKTTTFQWFHDEIVYVKKDFVGKTMEQIRAMHKERDLRYLST